MPLTTIPEVVAHFADRCDALNKRCDTLLECLRIERELRVALQSRLRQIETGDLGDMRDPVAEETNVAKIYLPIGGTDGR